MKVVELKKNKINSLLLEKKEIYVSPPQYSFAGVVIKLRRQKMENINEIITSFMHITNLKFFQKIHDLQLIKLIKLFS